LPRKRDA